MRLDGPRPKRPVATYSIVARDIGSGQLGVAVQSHWFGVGTVVPWAEAGVGAVATQSIADPAYGVRGLDLMRTGMRADRALSDLVHADTSRAVRQVAMVDVDGAVGVHTGQRCIAEAGHAFDSDLGVTCQANLMASDTVWGAMLDAYQRSLDLGDDLTDRLLAALDAAQAEGGDVRGRQSAALVVVAAEATGRVWDDRIFDVRVDDHPDPLVELRRLSILQRAYRHMNLGDIAIEAERFTEAMVEYTAASELAPQVGEIQFWTAVTLASVGEVDDAAEMLRVLYDAEPGWRDLLPKLVDAGLITADVASKAHLRS